MSPGIRAGLIALLLGLPGCTGVRFGCIGLGNPVVGVYRGVTVKGHWCPDSRHVIVERTTTKGSERFPMFLILPILVPCGTDYRIRKEWVRDEILLLDLSQPSEVKKLADGQYPQVCPQGTYVAYKLLLKEGTKNVEGTSVDPRQLWLLNYATGDKRLLEEYVTSCEFTKDGKWITWESRVDAALRSCRQFAAEVGAPSKPRTFGTEVSQMLKQGWDCERGWMADDGSRCSDWRRGGDPEKPPSERCRVRYAPPEWKMEVTALPSPAAREWVHIRPIDWSRDPSPDGKLILKRKKVEFLIPDLLVLPAHRFRVENLLVEFPDGTTRQVTHFKAPW